MRIGLCKEVIESEKRVLLTPQDAGSICDQGYTVLVERNAGLAAGYLDSDYSKHGAIPVSKEHLWETSDVVIKFKAPQRNEYSLVRQKQIIGAFMHAEGNQQLVKALCNAKATAYAFEFFKTENGFFPMSFVDSEVAGKLAVIYGMYHLQSHLGGAGVLLSPVVGAPMPKVVVIGYGNAGNAAIRVAEALGVEVVVVGRNKERLRKYQATVRSNVHCVIYSERELREQVRDADLVIGAIQISTFDTPPLLTDEMVKQMKKGAVIVDVTCGYGSGYMPSFDRSTSLQNPIYEKYGVLHCKIDILPAAVPITTTQAVSKNITPYLLNWFNSLEGTMQDNVSHAGLIIQDGIICHNEVKRHMDYWCAQNQTATE